MTVPTLSTAPPIIAHDPATIAGRFVDVARISRLGGERDANRLVEASDGSRYILKIVDGAEADTSIPLQIAALEHLQRHADIPTPRVVHTRDGDAVVRTGADAAWMLTYRAGTLLSDAEQDPVTLAALGGAAGRLASAIADFDHPFLDRRIEWDLTRAHQCQSDLSHVADEETRALAQAALDRLAALPDIAALPRQAIHGDLNPHNVIVGGGGAIGGIIDFGDLHLGIRVAELAIALCYHLHAGEQAVRDAVEAYRAETPLTEAEVAALPALAAARLAMTVAITARRAAERPQDAVYLRRNAPIAERGLRLLASGAPSGLTPPDAAKVAA